MISYHRSTIILVHLTSNVRPFGRYDWFRNPQESEMLNYDCFSVSLLLPLEILYVLALNIH